MKLATFADAAGPRVGIVQGDGVIDVSRHGVREALDLKLVIERWSELGAEYRALAERKADFPLASVRLQAPIGRPQKILCIGLNYADHCAEAGREIPKHPMWFSKVQTSVAGPFDVIELPPVTEQLDYEAEMVAVIGRRCRHVPRERAAEVIFGYCTGNDVSVRDWQRRTSQFFIGKAFDGHAPFGPWITTADSLEPHALDVRTTVNGELRQNSNTRHLIFDVYEQVANLTQAMTLMPGDLIFTGTPGGVGSAMKPPRFLADGDTVRIEIQSLGAIESRVKRGTADTLIG